MFGTLVKKRDFYAGGLMTLLGAAVTLNSMTYTLGTLTHMGPGMFPLMLGITLTFVGVLILGTALFTPLGDDEHILPRQREWRGWGCILAGPILFIILGEYFGLVPATFACVFVSALGDRTATLKGSAYLAAGITFFGVLLFIYVLEDSFPHVPVWPLMIETALTDLWYGFGVALEPHNIMWCFIGVFVGNMVGVLPGMGALATISILLPLTFGIKPVGAILMLAGVFYGSQYGGAICSILLNLPCHPPHAVTCLDGFPLTKQGRGGAALGITVISSFVGASWGITEMIFLAPVLVTVALKFGPAEICSLMLLGLLAGSTLARGSPLKGVAMTILGLLIGIVGSDIETGTPRFTFGIPNLFDGVEIVALALGLFGIAEFMKSVNQLSEVDTKYTNVKFKDLRPTREEFRRAVPAMFRGTIIGSLCALIPGTGPTIASFISYATEKKISKTPENCSAPA